MANFNVLDAYGSVITIQSSTFGTAERQVVGASIIGALPISIANTSVSGTVGASIIGLPPVAVTNTPSISGTVETIQSGVVITSIAGTISASLVGTVPVTQSGTVITSVSGTVVVQSVVGTYAKDAAHSMTDKGLFVLAVRNDTLASVTSGDGDYSQVAVGPVGETVVANAPITKWVRGVASCFTGIIQPIIAAQGASVFTYITSGQAANASANNAYLTFYGATDSVVGYLPVPANSGALPIMPNAWKTNANGAFSASVSGVASVYLSFQGFIAKE